MDAKIIYAAEILTATTLSEFLRNFIEENPEMADAPIVDIDRDGIDSIFVTPKGELEIF